MSAIQTTNPKSASKMPAIQTRLPLDEAVHPEKQIPEVARAECVALLRLLIEVVVMPTSAKQSGGQND